MRRPGPTAAQGASRTSCDVLTGGPRTATLGTGIPVFAGLEGS